MKYPRTPVVLLILIFAAVLLSCSDEEEQEPPLVLNKLEAKAGVDQQVVVNSLVMLDGSASVDGNEKPFAFQWTFKSRPTQSMAVLQNATSATPSFTPDIAGLYTVELRITQDDFFKTDFVVITVSNTPVTQARILRDNITTDQHLEDVFEDPAKADYIVSTDLTVTAKLTVAPGVVIEFEENKSLQIFPQGTLIAKGTSTENIIFTGRVKNKGYWKGIALISNNADNELDHVYVSYGGSSPMPDAAVKANILLAGEEFSGAALKISNTNLTESGGYGLYVAGQSQLNYFSGNYFTNNASSAIYVPAAQLHKLDFFSHYTGGNGYNGVETGGMVKNDAEVQWHYFNDGSTYLVSRDLMIESGVTIGEGATFEFTKDIALRIHGEGYLNATGTSLRPVVFTARNTSPDHYWKGITFDSGHELNRLEYAVISHSGYSSAPETAMKANVNITATGTLTVKHSRLEKGLGWGIAAADGAHFNAELTTTNTFSELQAGKYKLPFSESTTALLAGDWVDLWSLNNEQFQISALFFNTTSGIWFDGASDPWNMSPQTGFGLKIQTDGSYLWTIAEASPMTGCVSYSAEYITGKVIASGNELAFDEDFWRSKFYNSCAADQNADINVEPGEMTLRYELDKMYNMFTGQAFWQLKLINPDNSSFTYYRPATNEQ